MVVGTDTGNKPPKYVLGPVGLTGDAIKKATAVYNAGGTTSTTATTSAVTVTTYAYYQGSSQNTVTPYTYSNAKASTTTGPAPCSINR